MSGKRKATKTEARSGSLEVLDEETVDLGTLLDDPNNVNVHDERNLEAITASIKRFGQVKRLVARKSDRVVFAGNGVTEVLRRLGRPKAHIQWVEGTDDECRAFAVADNRTNRLSRFDDARLAELLQDLHGNDPGLRSAAGYNDEELARLLRDQEKAPPKDGERKGAMGLQATCPKCGHTFPLGSEKK